MKRAVIVCALLSLICCGGGGRATSGVDAGSVAVDAASDGGSSPMDAGTPVDLCAGVSCATAPAGACVGSIQRTYDPVGTCSDGVCSYASHDTACAAGCENAVCVDPCAGVTCTNPPGPSCDGDQLKTFANTGTCSSGSCSYASSESTCELGCRNTTCFNPDPRLEDPARVSLPLECPGTLLTAAQIIEHVAQGGDTIHLVNDTRNPPFAAFSAFKTSRTCQPLTGCGAWTTGGSESYAMRLWVSASGDLQLIQDDQAFAGDSEVEATISSGDLQTVFGNSSHGGTTRQFKVRITRTDDGHGCVSAVSVIQQDPPKNDGSHVESFWLASSGIAAPVPRTTPAPLGPWPFKCAGTPASNAEIASWFGPGQTQLAFRSSNESRVSTQQCHPITGCSPWDLEFLTIPQLRGLKTTATAFTLWFDTDVIVPLVNGMINITVGSATYTGLVTTDKCVSYDRTAVVNTPPSAMVTTTHTEEQNVVP